MRNIFFEQTHSVNLHFLQFLTIFLLIAFLITPGPCIAEDLKTCMSEKIHQVDDSMTIAEVRLACQELISQKTPAVQKPPAGAMSERLRQQDNHIVEPFTLMAHKPNYFLLAAFNSTGYNSEIFQKQFDDPSINMQDTEAQFQISIKFPLAVNLLDTFDIYAAYTNRSFWQVYNSDLSEVFRETNHEPEGWIQFNPTWDFFGFKNSANMFGFVHQSNGRAGTLSRSWNRLYANFMLERGNFALSLKPYYRISEDDDEDDNPDITDYLGHYELRGVYRWNDHVLSLMSRNNLESGFTKGALEASWSFPLGSYPYLKGYVQYFTGYGESLIDYNQYVNRIGIGVALTDWL